MVTQAETGNAIRPFRPTTDGRETRGPTPADPVRYMMRERIVEVMISVTITTAKITARISPTWSQ